MLERENVGQEQLSPSEIEELLGLTTGPQLNATSDDGQDTQEEQPGVVMPELPKKEDENDERRYQYHQARADRMLEENAALKARLAALEAKKPEEPAQEDEDVEFPPPPAEPEVPFGFSEEDARSNPQSDSARYVRQYSKWQADMLKYNTYLTQWGQLQYQIKLEALNKKLEAEENAKREQAAQNAKIEQLKGEIITKYKVAPQFADDFINVMSNPDNFNLDNQIKFYMMLKGGGSPKPAPQSFQQASNAQQFPTPMAGIQVPGASPSLGKSEDDLIFDALKGIEDKGNWMAPRK
jgi:hypothetical protein